MHNCTSKSSLNYLTLQVWQKTLQEIAKFFSSKELVWHLKNFLCFVILRCFQSEIKVSHKFIAPINPADVTILKSTFQFNAKHFHLYRHKFWNCFSSSCFIVLQILGVSEMEFMDQMGVYFVNFVSQYGYDRVLSVLGRHMRDFLNGLDNLHEYLKFSYPLMR